MNIADPRKPTPSRSGLVPALLVITLAVIGSLVWWNNGLRDRFYPKNFGIVEPGAVYRAGRLAPDMLTRVVNEHHIRTVIDLGADPIGSEHDTAVAEKLRTLGVRRIRMDLSGDGTGNPNCYVRALHEMADPSNHPMLVQCGAGAQRTGVACALYENIIRGAPLDAALDHAEEHRFSRTKDKPAMDYLAKWKDAIERAYREGTEIEGFDSMAKDPAP